MTMQTPAQSHMQSPGAPALARRAALEATINGIYAAFGRGDVAAILGTMTDDVLWDEWAGNTAQCEPAVPYLVARRGPAGAGEFFAMLGTFTFHELAVLSVFAGDDEAVARITADFSLPNGARVRDEEIHWWQFDAAGRVIAFRHYVDTAKHRAAAVGEGTTAVAAAAQ